MKKGNYIAVIITLLVLILATAVLFISSGDRKTAECSHKYSDFEEVLPAGPFTVGEKQKSCRKCGDTVSERIKATVSLPQLYLEGSTDGLSKTSDCLLKAEYSDSKTQINAYAAIKYQGHTAMAYGKKNYTLKLYEDETRGDKYKVSLNGWDETHKFCLKANYIDFSSARNIVSSNIWSDVVACRQGKNENIGELEFFGGIDGYPFALFINDRYQGLYTFNIPKDEDTYRIADEKNEAMFMVNSAFSDAAKFRALITEEDKASVFDLEYTYPENSQWAYDSLNSLIDFVINNDGEDFVRGIDKYLDVDAAIDYLISAYVLGVSDNFEKNMMLLTYDGVRWIPNMYDLDTACGLMFDGTGYLEPDFSLPAMTEGGISSGTQNLLWDRILNNFSEEFKERYSELRKDVLSTDKLISRYTEFISSVPDECYTYEKELYPDRPQKDTAQIEQISAFIKARTRLLDKIVAEF